MTSPNASDPIVVMDLPKAWGLVVLRGVLAVLFGLFTLIWPGLTALAFAIVFGVYALVDGIGLLMDAFRNPDKSNRGMRVFGGILGIAAGIIAIVWPGITVAALAILVGAWALVTGIAEIAAAIRLRKQIEGELLLGLAGLLSAIFGVLVLLWPALGVAAIAAFIGVFALVYGVVLIGLGFRLRKLART
ncbi:HdeD family acid-resistance protein [Kibdelosporangium philippinense]|uniref:HdeD family acid-resistance protein n=2 Tax=Kibdelosporangium philippinense TaxID=211113 RepID=A0ABS8ZG31_9PSEU|nr:HdeD family acid-resistance protein [Kibdelosporangium philippinense]MCE7006780.1 HdeD family acid-resistance protein [Kibdelosporangium philippinense]